MKLVPIAVFTIGIAVFSAGARDVNKENEGQVPSSEVQHYPDALVENNWNFYYESREIQLLKGIPSERRRGRSFCRRKLGGRCVRRRKRCPGHLPSQTSPGKPYCSKFHRCCHKPKEECSTSDGFFKVPDAGDQCFKVFPQNIEWEGARSACEAEGLQLAKPEFPIELRKFILDIHGNQFVWLGARGSGHVSGPGNDIKWIRDETIIYNNNSFWFPTYPGSFTSSDYCLDLRSHSGDIALHPLKPFAMANCYSNFFPLCEKVN